MADDELSVQTDELTVEYWRAVVAEGADIPATIYTFGASMFPLLRAKGDAVRIMPLRRQLIKGDIIVFLRADQKYVAHRVFWFDEKMVQTWGDNCPEPDAKIMREDVVGLVTHALRGDKLIYVDTPLWRAYGRVTKWSTPFRMFVKYQIISRLYRVWKKIKK